MISKLLIRIIKMKNFKDKLDDFNKEISNALEALSNKTGVPNSDYHSIKMINIDCLNVRVNSEYIIHINHKVAISESNIQYSTLSLPTSKLCTIIDAFLK
jgi:hypothetical protein